MEAPLSDDPVLITELSLHPHMVEGARDHFISCSVMSVCDPMECTLLGPLSMGFSMS